MTRLLVLSTLLAVSLALASAGSAGTSQTPKLHAKVGPGFFISLTDAAGTRVTKLDPGTYEIEVEDESDQHNFHLTGPGVDRATLVPDEGKETWTVSLSAGTYWYVCDPHSARMKGSFTVGSVQQSPPSTGGAAVTAKTRLVLTSGPRFSIRLTTAAGAAVKALKAGTYTVVVRDRSPAHDARLVAPGYDRRTKPLAYVGTQTWKVPLKRAGVLRFLCDPHAGAGMKGSAKIVA